MRNVLWLGVTYLLVAGCGDSLDTESSGQPIIGGELAEPGEIPAMAYVGTDPVAFGGFFQWCGATVVAEHFVVTAAHCIDLFPLDFGEPELVELTDLRIITGKVSRSNFTLDDLNPVVAGYIHPNFDSVAFVNDIAVLQVANPMDVEAMPLMTTRAEARRFSDGDIATVAGWGSVDPENIFGSVDDLHRVDVPIVNRATCDELYEEGIFGPIEITDAMICAGDIEDGGVDSCLGDSGGPLLAPLGGGQVLGGVVSFGEALGCASPDFPGVYSRVAVAASWIEQCIADQGMCGGLANELAAIRPTVDCVEKIASGRWRAHFGYRNENSIGVAIPRGADNLFLPGFQVGQAQAFKSGAVARAFTSDFRGLAAWVLTDPSGDTRVALAHPLSPRCE